MRTLTLPTALLFALVLPASLGSANASVPGTFECEDLSQVPIDFSVDYETEIQPIFTGGCANCHVQSPFPDAGLRLDPGKSYTDIVGVASAQNPNWLRVAPGRSDLSLLFLKVNCNAPPVGVRMPLDRQPLSLEAQARIMDWINQGALATPAVPDFLFRAEFETRG